MIIIGLDPWIATTGYGIINQEQNNLLLIDYWCIKTSSKIPLANRLFEIKQDLETLLKKYSPHIASIEKIFFNTNITTWINVAQARGVILETCFSHKLEIMEFTPLQVKNNTVGYGQAEKKQVEYMIRQILKIPNWAKLQDDSADALSLAIIASDFKKNF